MKPNVLPTGVAAALLAAGCATTTTPSAPRSVQVESVDAGSRRLVSAESGLELRKWLVADDPARIAATIGACDGGDEFAPIRRAALRRNGFRLARVPMEDLDALLERLDGATMNVNAWHGQIVQWRALHEIPLGRQSVTVAVDGHVRSFRGGAFALTARAWAVQLETGPRLQLELVPEFREPTRPGDLRQLLGQSSPRRQRFPSMAVEAELEEGYAYLLTAAPPGERWTADEAADDDAAPAAPSPVGPEVIPPITLGQLMLASEAGTRQRAILLFVPRVPGDPDAPDAVAASPARRPRR